MMPQTEKFTQQEACAETLTSSASISGGASTIDTPSTKSTSTHIKLSTVGASDEMPPPLKEFTLFPKLPTELKLKVWNEVMPDARVIEVLHEEAHGFHTTTPTPPIFHACVGSRIYMLEKFEAVVVEQELSRNEENDPAAATNAIDDQSEEYTTLSFGAYFNFGCNKMPPPPNRPPFTPKIAIFSVKSGRYGGGGGHLILYFPLQVHGSRTNWSWFLGQLSTGPASNLQYIAAPTLSTEWRAAVSSNFKKIRGAILVAGDELVGSQLETEVVVIPAHYRRIVGFGKKSMKDTTTPTRWDHRKGEVFNWPLLIRTLPRRPGIWEEMMNVFLPKWKPEFTERGAEEGVVKNLEFQVINIIRAASEEVVSTIKF